MDRRQFLVGVARTGLAAGLLAVVDACAGPAPPSLLGILRGSPAPPSSTSPSGQPTPGPPAPGQFPRDNPTAAENRRAGNHGWDLTAADGPSGATAFAAAASVAPGDTLDLHVASPTAFDVEWYRLGWYEGSGGRLVRQDRGLVAAPAAPRAIDRVTGRVEAAGGRVLSVPVDGAWPSGVYLAVVRPTVGPPAYAPFTVRAAPTASSAPVLFVNATTTWQAYNAWGGADLYDASTADAPEGASGRRAVQVSYDRPQALGRGAGYMPRWELQFVRWQEREGRDVDYCADVDLELHPEVVTGRRLILFVGHHEYWSRPMRATIEGAIAAGTNVAFLSADDMAWQIRLEPSPLGPARRITCYKSSALDPLASTQPAVATCRWREPPVNDPEALVIGEMYGHIVARPADWIVAGSGHWLYEATGLGDGDAIRNLVGQEFDTFFPTLAHPGTVILARSPVVPIIHRAPRKGVPLPLDEDVQTATAYVADSGATVIAAGTFQWSWALDDYGDRSYHGVATPLDGRVARMTTNILDRLGDGRGTV